MKIVLLAGGLGTRMREETEYRPKPMVPIGGKPILWHIMKYFSTFNLEDFVVCTGYKGEIISEYFKDFKTMNMDFTIHLGEDSKIITHGDLQESQWRVTIAYTGAKTMTGGRLFKVQKYLNNETFLCTYGDGLADIDVNELVNFHKAHGKIATLTTVRPTSRFGVLDLREDNSVSSFKEKPQAEGWINAGFFVFEPQIFDFLNNESVLEADPLSRLANANQLVAYKHSGFWQPIDTYREIQMMNDLWDAEEAPWKRWN